MAAISEKAVESHCKKETKRRGGQAFKFSSPSRRGVPDQLLLFPGGKVAFLELKAPGKKPSKVQTFWLNTLQNLGFTAGYADSKESVNTFLDRLEHA